MLPIKRKWYDMIFSGEKTEEYREIKPYYDSRLPNNFGMFPEKTLLNWLLNMGYDIYDDFLEVIDDIESGYAELEDYRKDPSVFDEEEIEFLKTDIEDWEQQIAEIKADFLKGNENADWEKEVENVNQFWKERERLINE